MYKPRKTINIQDQKKIQINLLLFLKILKPYLSNTMPVDGKVFCQQTVLKLNNDSIPLLCLDGGSRSSAINGDNQLLIAIRGPILILHLPPVTSKSGLTNV